MMTTMELLRQLTNMGANLSFEGDKLRCSAPSGVLTPILQKEIFEKKAELIALLKKADTKSLSKVPPFTKAPRDGFLPLSFAQQRLWLLDQIDPDSRVYYSIIPLQIKGPLHVPALERSLLEMIDRHEVLRTNFSTIYGEPFQHIQQVHENILKGYDLQHYSNLIREEHIRSIFQHTLLDPYDLANDLLIRASLLHLEPDNHILLIGLHHIIIDGWSRQILIREFIALYEAARRGDLSPLPPLPIQYADYALWQRNYLQGEVLETQLAYWRTQLAGAPPLLELPTDFPRPLVQSYRGNHLTLAVPAALVTSLETLSRQAGVTMFMMLLAAFQVVLSRYSGQKDIVVGTPIANRTQREIEGLIGFFVNTLVLRSDLTGDPSFMQLLSQVREVCLGAYAHQDLPFEKLVEDLQPTRSLSHQPLFQVSFDMHNQPQEILAIDDLIFTDVDIEVDLDESVNYDLEIEIDITSHSGLTIGFYYATDLFERSTIERLKQHFLTLLEELVRTPERSISQFSLLADAQRQQILFDWNATAMALPLERSFPQMFQAQVQRTPEAIAVICGPVQVTFRELSDRANCLASSLLTLGITTEDRIGLFCERSVDLLVGMLAIFQAGGVYVPLDPLYPPQRLASLVQDAQLAVLLAHPAFLDRLPAFEGVISWLDSAALFPQAEQCACLVQGEQLAYMIYTSGSTGHPKGAMVTHQGMLNHLYAKVVDLHLTAQDRVAQTANQGFDIAVWQLVVPLLVGGCVHIFCDEIIYTPSLLADAIEREAISIWEMVPQYLQTLLDDPSTPSHTFAQLHFMLTTAEALSPALCRRWFAQYGHVPIVNAYGPTECSDDVTHHLISTPPLPQSVLIPIGRPLINTQLYILDANLQPVPPLVSGMLYVGGTGVGRGYFRDPAKTASVFVPDPFSQTRGARLYRTGDIARYLSDGTIEFLGRRDYQVKIRGFRVELGEIEAVLRKHPALQDVVISIREDEDKYKDIVAYVLLQIGQELTTSDMRIFVKQYLPEYMVPAILVILERFPLTTNGKVDREALPAPSKFRPALIDAYVPPQSVLEQDIAEIWMQVLQIEKIGVNDNFFDLGGHSLLLVQVHTRICELLKRDTPLINLFQYTTVRTLADHFCSMQEEDELNMQQI